MCRIFFFFQEVEKYCIYSFQIFFSAEFAEFFFVNCLKIPRIWAMQSLTSIPPLDEYVMNNFTSSFLSLNTYNASGLSLHIYILEINFSCSSHLSTKYHRCATIMDDRVLQMSKFFHQYRSILTKQLLMCSTEVI